MQKHVKIQKPKHSPKTIIDKKWHAIGKWKFTRFFEPSRLHPRRNFLRRFFLTSGRKFEKSKLSVLHTEKWRHVSSFQYRDSRAMQADHWSSNCRGYLHIIMSKSLEVLMVIVFSPPQAYQLIHAHLLHQLYKFFVKLN